MHSRVVLGGAVILFAAWASPLQAHAQSSGLLGDWKTTAGSIVRVGPCGNTLCITLVQLINTLGYTTDVNNPDPAQRSRPLCGLLIGKGFIALNANRASGGTLYDPKTGKTYHGQMTADGAKLNLRGYVGVPLFGASEIWTRPDGPVTPCIAPQH